MKSDGDAAPPQFDPAEASVSEEKKANLALISKLGSGGEPSSKKARRDGGGDGDNVVNVRKAVRFASKGQGGVAMARKAGGGGGKGGKKGKGR